MTEQTHLKTFIWFPGNMDEALAFYEATFSDFKINSENRPDADKPRFTADFSTYGHDFIGMNPTGCRLCQQSHLNFPELV